MIGSIVQAGCALVAGVDACTIQRKPKDSETLARPYWSGGNGDAAYSHLDIIWFGVGDGDELPRAECYAA